MAKVFLTMAMSLDGFITGPHDDAENPAGDNGMRLLGQGRRLFDDLPPEHIELDLVRTLEAPGTLHLRYEVRHP